MLLDQTIEKALIELIRDVARHEIAPRFRRLHPDAVRTKAAFDDLVTEADLCSEQAITAGVNRLLPDAVVIGEEAVAANPALLDRLPGAKLAVVIDPIDGTWNFANGLAIHGVLIAVTERDETQFGLLYDPVMDDWIMARRGGGAWYCRPDSEPVQLFVSSEKPLNAMIGFISTFGFAVAERAHVNNAVLGFARAHALRCACHEYRLLVQGNVDFYINASAKPWDHAAGALAVQEAGGAVGMMDGREYAPTLREGCVIAANSPQALDAIRQQFTNPERRSTIEPSLREE
ncbi:inositol monophosphatase [Marinobacterium sp. D7]|uniref:inositol monophosphatase family protein n=1 Tax=Marinobacterium ramblicola TaxID=2849041 RepID=UPI001C2D8107|nr:inositol monophosphatase [Marinobacterium ramblicola]MBV1788151.1 inositol monophosphatase [Marinobacterium ramblicola]